MKGRRDANEQHFRGIQLEMGKEGRQGVYARVPRWEDEVCEGVGEGRLDFAAKIIAQFQVNKLLWPVLH